LRGHNRDRRASRSRIAETELTSVVIAPRVEIAVGGDAKGERVSRMNVPPLETAKDQDGRAAGRSAGISETTVDARAVGVGIAKIGEQHTMLTVHGNLAIDPLADGNDRRTLGNVRSVGGLRAPCIKFPVRVDAACRTLSHCANGQGAE